MKKFPKRIRNHELETESKRAFESIIPNSWVSNLSPAADYGIDGSVEIIRNGEARGEEFKVQLKSTDSDDEPESVNLEMSTYNYYQEISKLCPILMILYHSKTKNIYVKWFHEFDPYYDKSGKKTKRPENSQTITFYWDKNNLWDDETIEKIKDDMALFKQIKTHQIHPPFSFYIKHNVDTIFDKSIASILLNLNNKIAHLNLFNFTFENNPDAIGIIEITDKKISCNFKMNIGGVLHLDNKIIASEDAIVNLIIALMINALGQVNFNSYTTHLSRLIIDSKIIFIYDSLTAMVINSLVDGKDWNSYIKILSNLDNYANSLDDEKKSLIKIKIFIGLIIHGKYIENNEIIQILINNIRSQGYNLSGAYYNLGNHYRHNGKMIEAFHYYNLAQKSNKNYKERDYFWAELAGGLFECGRYKWSAEFYNKALKINRCSETLCLYADALLYSGEYQQAQEVFEEYLSLISKRGEQIFGEWYLKYIALNFMLKITGIKKQNRNTETVSQIIENARLNSKEFTEEDVAKLLEFDMLSGDAWYAYAYVSQSEYGNSHIWALFCSALFDCVVPDLLKFLIYMMQDTDNKNEAMLLAYNIIDFILFKGKETELIEAFTEIAKNNPDIVNMFYKIIQQIKAEQKKSSCVLRFCSDDGVHYVHEI